MNFLEFFSPLFRQKVATGVAILASGILVFLGINLLPESQKTTLYFSVKILETSESKNLKDPPESAAKLAETIAGWAKDPGFRAEILTRAKRGNQRFQTQNFGSQTKPNQPFLDDQTSRRRAKIWTKFSRLAGNNFGGKSGRTE